MILQDARCNDKYRLKVFKNRVFRKTFGHKRDEVRGERRKLHSEELSDLYFSPNSIRVIKSRRMRFLIISRNVSPSIF